MLLRKPGVTHAIRLDLLEKGLSLDTLGQGYSWPDLYALVLHWQKTPTSHTYQALIALEPPSKPKRAPVLTAAQIRAAILSRETET